MPTPDKRKEAFEAWRRAVDEHIDMMGAVTDGEMLDPHAMTERVDAIDVLRATWMDMVGRRDAGRGDSP